MAESRAMSNFRANVSRMVDDGVFSISQIARDAGVSRPSLSNLLRGLEECTISRAERIADAVDVALADLITDRKASPATKTRARRSA